MIISVRIANFTVFRTETEFTMKADMRNRWLLGLNSHECSGYSVLSGACLFGPNNAGKTCFIRAVRCIRDIMLGKDAANEIIPSRYGGDDVCSLGMSFCYEGKAHSYDLRYDSSCGSFVYECFRELYRDRQGHERGAVLFVRDMARGTCRFGWDRQLSKEMESVPGETAVIYGLDASSPAVLACREIMQGFASAVDVVDMNDISLDKTIETLKHGRPIKEKVLRLIKMSGVYIDNLEYVDDPDAESLDDCMKLYSCYNGIRTRTVGSESAGTLKLIALASYIVDSIDSGRTLFADHFGGDMHISLLKSLAVLFASDLRCRGQLVFATHDLMMMDICDLFRKDQIWFIEREKDDADIYALSDFTDLHGKIRSGYDLLEKYQSGWFGAIPDTDYLDLDDDPSDLWQ